MGSGHVTTRVAVVGCGWIGAVHSRALRGLIRGGLVDAAVVALCDADLDRALAFARVHDAELATTDPVEAMAEADVVWICTPTGSHRALVEQATAAGLGVFCEKPLATSLAAARAMADGVAAAGVVNQVGLVLRSSPAFLELKHQIEDPRSGRVQAAVLRDDQFLPVQGMYGSTWRADPARAGAGTMLEHSIHDVDALEWLLGPAVSVGARSSTFHGNPGIEDTVSVGMELADGAQVSLTSVWHQLLERPSLRRLEVICEHAFLTVEHDVLGPVTWTRPGAQGALEGEELLSAVAERHGGSAPNQDRGFVEAVASGQRGSHPDLQTALRAHEVVDGIYRSAAAGGVPVDVAPR